MTAAWAIVAQRTGNECPTYGQTAETKVAQTVSIQSAYKQIMTRIHYQRWGIYEETAMKA